MTERSEVTGWLGTERGGDERGEVASATRHIDEYLEAEVQRLLAEHLGIAEQGISVVRREQTLVLCGEVESERRRDEIVRLVAENFPEVRVVSDIGLTRTNPPAEAEELL